MKEKSFILKKINSLRVEDYVFALALLTYIFFWFVNPGNKIIAVVLSLVFPFLLNIKIKDFRYSLALAYFASSIIPSGKTYTIEIFPPGYFDAYVFPDGVSKTIVFTSSHVITVLFLLTIFRDLVLGNIKKINIDIFTVVVLLFFLWSIISDIYGSKWVEYSLLFNLFSSGTIVFYFYLKIYVKRFKNIIPVFIALFIAQIIFETFVVSRQLISGSPVYKRIEAVMQIDTDQFGLSGDELGLKFRPMGTFGHANELGMWFAFYLSILFPYVYLKADTKKLLGMILGFSGLIVTLSRSAWLGFFMSLLLTLYVLEKVKHIKFKFSKKFRRYFYVIPLLSVLALIFIVPRAINSINSFSYGTGAFRVKQYGESLKLIKTNPLFGIGTGMFLIESVYEDPYSFVSGTGLDVHNWYLLTSTEHGIPTMIIFTLLILLAVRKNLVVLFNNTKLKSLDKFRVGVNGALLSTLIVGFLQPFMLLNPFLYSFAILEESKK